MSAVMQHRPEAHALPDGRIAVYVGASYHYVRREAAVAMINKLHEALGLPVDYSGYRAFALHVASQQRVPNLYTVMHTWDVSRATACRWLARVRAEQGELNA